MEGAQGNQIPPTHASTGPNDPTQFTYECTYTHAGNVAPQHVRLVVDGEATYAMAQVGSGTSWMFGEEFRALINLGVGGHTYHFEARDSLGADARLPEAGTFGGPQVSASPRP